MRHGVEGVHETKRREKQVARKTQRHALDNGEARGAPEARSRQRQTLRGSHKCPGRLAIILEKYVMTGKVNVIFKDYTIIGQDSMRAAHAAHCASEQGKFWEYHDTLYNNWGGENSGWAGSENILRFAEEVGLNMNEFVECNVDKRYEQQIAASNTDAQKLGITGTPAFYVISANSQQVQTISGAQPYEVFEKVFNSMLEN